MHCTLDEVQAALSLADFDVQAAQLKMMPSGRSLPRSEDKPDRPRLGGVLLFLYCLDDELYLVLTRRRDDLNSHAGQISFPGGRHEPPETLQATALRETHEEIGIAPDAVTVVGQLTTLYIQPSDFEVHPFVGFFNSGERPQFIPDPREVAEIIEVGLGRLLDPQTRAIEPWTLHGFEVEVPYFRIDDYKVWGATAMMLSEFVERLRWVRRGQR